MQHFAFLSVLQFSKLLTRVQAMWVRAHTKILPIRSFRLAVTAGQSCSSANLGVAQRLLRVQDSSLARQSLAHLLIEDNAVLAVTMFLSIAGLD
jgi:hypothetical protein